MKRSAGVVGGLAVTALLLTGCSRSLAADDIERELERQLSTQGFVPDVTCDEDLQGEVGATIRCDSELEGGVPVVIVVTATEVSGDQIRYEFIVEPQGTGDIDEAPGNGGASSPPATSPAG